MGEVEITKMSSRGQVVIPQEIREEMGLNEGVVFAVTGSGDSLLLKRIKTPSKDELMKSWNKLLGEGQKRVKKLGLKEKNVSKLLHNARGITE